MPYRHAPGTIYRRAMRRVERRASILRAYALAHPECRPFEILSAEYVLLVEATRTANRLAYCAGIA